MYFSRAQECICEAVKNRAMSLDEAGVFMYAMDYLNESMEAGRKHFNQSDIEKIKEMVVDTRGPENEAESMFALASDLASAETRQDVFAQMEDERERGRKDVLGEKE